MYEFTKRAEKAIEQAGIFAESVGHEYIGTEHLLYGLAKEVKIADYLLSKKNINKLDIIIDWNEDDIQINKISKAKKQKELV